MTTAAQKKTIDEMDARQRLQALRLLDERKQRVENELGAAAEKWREQLKNETQAMNELIKAPSPSAKECKGRLEEIKAAFETREESKEAKKREVNGIKARLSAVEVAMLELIRSEPTDQMALELDGASGPGLAMTSETAKVVGEALTDHVQQGGQLTPDMDDLQKRLNEMGVEGLRLVHNEAPSDSADDEDGEGEDDGEDF